MSDITSCLKEHEEVLWENRFEVKSRGETIKFVILSLLLLTFPVIMNTLIPVIEGEPIDPFNPKLLEVYIILYMAFIPISLMFALAFYYYGKKSSPTKKIRDYEEILVLTNKRWLEIKVFMKGLDQEIDVQRECDLIEVKEIIVDFRYNPQGVPRYTRDISLYLGEKKEFPIFTFYDVPREESIPEYDELMELLLNVIPIDPSKTEDGSSSLRYYRK